MTNEELKQLVASNAKSIQALGDQISELTNDVNRIQEQTASERTELRGAVLGIANLLSKLDDDRPTILRRLNSIETMLERLLEREGDQ
ncbi:MAG: hypothetical protein AAGG51_27145 [Cyanobacteria bacterium P01_G01_bin.54]